MTPELKKIVAAAEDELKGLQTKMAPIRKQYDELTAKLQPYEQQLRVLESQMDELKPRLRELEEKLVHARKLVS